MVKDGSKITDENIRSHWDKDNKAHDAMWNALVRIGEEYGLGFDENGNELFSETPGKKNESVVPLIQAPAIDMTKLQIDIQQTIKTTLTSGIKPNVTVKIDDSFYQKNNNVIFDSVTEKWNVWISEKIKELLKAHGVVQDICIDGEHAYKMEQPVVEGKHQEWVQPKKPSAFTKFRHRIWQDVVSSFWKSFVYFALVCCACFGFYQWWYNQKMKQVVKEYMVVRSLLEKNKVFNEYMDGIDELIQEERLDEIYKYVEAKKKIKILTK